MTPYLLYKGTFFVHKTWWGTFKPVKGYSDVPLPPESVIKSTIKKYRINFRNKNFAMFTFDDVNYEIAPGWGIVAGNLQTDPSVATLDFLLQQPRVEAVIFVNDQGVVEHVISKATKSRQEFKAAVSSLQIPQHFSGQ